MYKYFKKWFGTCNTNLLNNVMPLSQLGYIYWLIHLKVLAHIITCPKSTIEILNVFNKDIRTTRTASLPRQFWTCSALPSIVPTDVFKKASSWWVINPSTKWFHDIETRPLICSVNQLNGFYMVGIFIDDWLWAKKKQNKIRPADFRELQNLRGSWSTFYYKYCFHHRFCTIWLPQEPRLVAYVFWQY